jgi:hypothetical protein
LQFLFHLSVWLRFMVVNVTFNNISVIPVTMTVSIICGENHPVVSHWKWQLLIIFYMYHTWWRIRKKWYQTIKKKHVNLWLYLYFICVYIFNRCTSIDIWQCFCFRCILTPWKTRKYSFVQLKAVRRCSEYYWISDWNEKQ